LYLENAHDRAVGPVYEFITLRLSIFRSCYAASALDKRWNLQTSKIMRVNQAQLTARAFTSRALKAR